MLNTCYDKKVVPFLDTITVGNNVTIGASSMIMFNVKIDNNVIVRA